MADALPMKLTKIQLRSADLSELLGEPEIMWPPEKIPDVLSVGHRTFVLASTNAITNPTYRLAHRIGITNYDVT
jgi:hypothetical protein